MHRSSKFAPESREFEFSRKLRSGGEVLQASAIILRIESAIDVYSHNIYVLNGKAEMPARPSVSFSSLQPRRELVEKLVEFFGEQIPRGLGIIGSFGVKWSSALDVSVLKMLESAINVTDVFLEELEDYELSRDEYCFSLGCHLSSPHTPTEDIVRIARLHVARWTESHPYGESREVVLPSLRPGKGYSSSDLKLIQDNLQYWNPICSQWDYTTYKSLTGGSEARAVSQEVVDFCRDDDYRDLLNVITRVSTSSDYSIRDRLLGDIDISELSRSDVQPFLADIPIQYPEFRRFLKSMTVGEFVTRYVFSSNAPRETAELDVLEEGELPETRPESEKVFLELESLVKGLPFSSPTIVVRNYRVQILNMLRKHEADTYFLRAVHARLSKGSLSLERFSQILKEISIAFKTENHYLALMNAHLEYVTFRLTELTGDSERAFEILSEATPIGKSIATWEAYFSRWDTFRDLPVPIALDLLPA